MTPSASPRRVEPRIAYLSMEVGLENDLRTYSGGLGVLAGDTLRAAADLGVPAVAITLAHRKGYGRQSLDDEGRQTTEADPWSPEDRLEEVERIQVQLADRELHVRAWRYVVSGVRGHEIPVYLLDADVPENDPEDRQLTDQLYGGDSSYRLLQEAILGLGSAALLRTLGHRKIHTFHMNEGHSALVALALLEERLREREGGHVRDEDRPALGNAAQPSSGDGAQPSAGNGAQLSAGNEAQPSAGDEAQPSAADEAWVRDRCVFTTHTPVPAGHDRFSEELVLEVLGPQRLELLRGRGLDGGVLNMTHLALHFSRFVNGVALRHAQISRDMFPGRTITAITNGVHVPTWTCRPMAKLFDRRVPAWRQDPLNLRHACTLPLDELREARGRAKQALVAAVRERTGRSFDPDVLTLGFARRATAYKRADLLFTAPRRLQALARKHGGIQVVYAGKAHPRDEGGQALIRNIHRAAEALGEDVRVVYLENYDMELGKRLTSGVDVWLNNPEKPKEASGTSGMKAALNGVPNLSVLDGWWIEGYVEGATGWAIGGEWDEPSDREEEAADLYRLLEEEVLPLHRDEVEGGEELLRMRRHSIALNGSHFSARRMMLQYVDRAYRTPEDQAGRTLVEAPVDEMVEASAG